MNASLATAYGICSGLWTLFRFSPGPSTRSDAFQLSPTTLLAKGNSSSLSFGSADGGFSHLGNHRETMGDSKQGRNKTWLWTLVRFLGLDHALHSTNWVAPASSRSVSSLGPPVRPALFDRPSQAFSTCHTEGFEANPTSPFET